jgi:hypothetical protein
MSFALLLSSQNLRHCSALGSSFKSFQIQFHMVSMVYDLTQLVENCHGW